MSENKYRIWYLLVFICLFVDLENAQTTETIPEITEKVIESPLSISSGIEKETTTTTGSNKETTTTTTEPDKETTTSEAEKGTTTTTDEDLDSARSKPKPRVIKLKIDKRLTISDLKNRLEADVGVSTDYFKIIRVYSNLQEFEYTRLGDTLSSFVDDVKVSSFCTLSVN